MCLSKDHVHKLIYDLEDGVQVMNGASQPGQAYCVITLDSTVEVEC